jgi:nucleoside-diphosphate-sugar epimerase
MHLRWQCRRISMARETTSIWAAVTWSRRSSARLMRLRLRDVQFYEIWGFGTPRREFLHVDDAADALVRLMTAYSSDEHIDVGSGEEVSIMELAKMIAHIVGFSGELTMDLLKA